MPTSDVVEPIKVAIVEDHELVRDGLEVLVERQPRYRLVWSGSSLSELVETKADVDLLLLDLLLDGEPPDSTEIRTLVSRGVRVLAVTGVTRRVVVSEAGSAGVLGFVSKESGSKELIEAMEAVSAGRSWMCLNIRTRIMTTGAVRDNVVLTERETEVLAEYCQGAKVATIGRHLDISEHTVRHHIRSVREKLSIAGFPAPTQLELRRRAIELGVIPG
ncbi:MAG: response regulator transcription factor [Candidatus Nanopelagicales bacterium]